MPKISILMLGESLDRQGGIVSVEKLIINQAPKNLQILHIPTLSDGSKLHKILVFIKAVGTLLRRLQNQEADVVVVHIHVSERGSAFRQAITTTIAWLSVQPVILHAHGADFQIFYSSLPRIIKLLLSWAFRKATRFIVLSESWKKYYTENLGLSTQQVIVLPNPVKFPLQVPQRIGSKKIKFLFLGRIGQRKGAFDLITAFAGIPTEQKQNVELVIAGDGEVEKARNLVSALYLDRHINIMDWINEQQRDELLQKADAFVLPSYNEGLPMALLEAMSWSLAVITTPVGGISDLVISRQNGLLVTPGNIPDLTEAIILLIKDENLRLSLGKEARETVRPFDVRNYCSQLSDLYSSLSKFK